MCKSLFLQKIAKKEMEIIVYHVITFEPTNTCEAHQNDCHNLGLVKDKHIYGEKMAKKCRQRSFKKSLLFLIGL